MVERYEEVYLLFIYPARSSEELGPRWEEGLRREERGEESRCGELEDEWLGGGQ